MNLFVKIILLTTFNRAWSVVDIICIFGNWIGGPNWELKLPGGPGGGPGGGGGGGGGDTGMIR